MHRLVRILPVGQVALRVAALVRRYCQSVVVVNVALRALEIRVALGQRETRRAVVEGGASPARWGVAGRTVGYAECGARRRMRWIVRVLPVRQVALRVAARIRGDRQGVVIVDMALRALQVGVSQRQLESRRAVIEA